MRVHLSKFKRDGTARKEMVHIDHWDVWDLAHTLSLIIHPALIELKKVKHGHPCLHPEEIAQDKWPLPCDSCKCSEEYDQIMDKMIWAFEQLKDEDYDEQFMSGEIDNVLTPIDNDGNVVDENDPACIGRRLDDGPNHTWKVDIEGLREHERKIQEGLDLFGKYFRSLWD